MREATLIISNRNYSSWSLRGWLLTRLSGLPFKTELINDEASRAELLLRASSVRVPRLEHDGISVWDTLAIAVNREYAQPGTILHEGDEVALLPPVSGGTSSPCA